jgi:hypothetical protein
MIDAEATQEEIDNGVDLIRLIHNEFGNNPDVVKMQIATGKTFIDGRLWEGDRFLIPYLAVKGKVITVIGPDRRWRVKYAG